MSIEEMSHAEGLGEHEVFGDVSSILAVWGEEFRATHAEGGEEYIHPSQPILDFARLIEAKSASMLEGARAAESDFEAIDAIEKLHTFNLANTELLKQVADALLHSPKSVNVLAQTYPWVNTIQTWAGSFIADVPEGEYVVEKSV